MVAANKRGPVSKGRSREDDMSDVFDLVLRFLDKLETEPNGDISVGLLRVLE